MTFDNESIGVQFSYSQANPISDGTILVIGDTLALEAEGTEVDLKMSTYTLNMLHPTGAVSTTNFSIRMIKNNAGVSLQVDHDFGGGGDQSKTTLGLFITNSPNVFWQTNMAPRQFPNVAQCSLGSTKPPIQFDITRLLDDTAPSLFEADTLFTIIFTSIDILFTDKYQDQENMSNLAFDKNTATYWGSSADTFTSAGVGSQFANCYQDFEFSILLTKHGRIVNSSMYRLSTTGLVKTS
ncbi:hypothetical protein T492DRAFT_843287 [Pavlovales sp. CCMP2436]|nr:hypothetical protein T492DRAFT_843287 [Pavlovales sp. CCMP2436]